MTDGFKTEVGEKETVIPSKCVQPVVTHSCTIEVFRCATNKPVGVMGRQGGFKGNSETQSKTGKQIWRYLLKGPSLYGFLGGDSNKEKTEVRKLSWCLRVPVPPTRNVI